MGRSVDGASGNFFEYADVFSTHPANASGTRISLIASFWFRRADTTAGHIWGVSKNTGGSDTWFGARMASTTSLYLQRKIGSSKNAIASGTISSTAWNHGYWSWGGTGADESAGALNGGSYGVNTQNNNPGDLRVTSIGGVRDGSGGWATNWKGDVAEFAIWDLALTWAGINSGGTNPDDVPRSATDTIMKNALADGASPLYFPAGLISHWKFDEASGDAVDQMRVGRDIQSGSGPNHLTENGTCAAVDHPRIYTPGKFYSAPFPTPAAGGLSLVKFAPSGGDVVNVADGLQDQLELLRFGNDTENIADAEIPHQDMVRVLDSTEQVADDLPHVLGLLRALDDTEQVADGLLSVLGIVRALDSTVNVAAALQHQLELLHFANDAEQIADGLARFMALARVLDSTEQVAGGLLRSMAMARVLDATEQVGDTSTDSLGLLRFGDDVVNVADGVVSILGIVRFADDTLNIADAVQHQLELLRFGDDTVNVADALVRVRAMVRVLDAALNIADDAIRPMALTRALADTVQVADELLYLLGLIRFTPDSIEVADALQRTFGLIRAIDEAEEIADAALEKATPVVGLGPQFGNTVEEIADGAVFARVMVRPAPADVEEIGTATLAQLGLLGIVGASVNVAEGLVPVCKPVASFGVLKIYDGTQWVAGPEFFAS